MCLISLLLPSTHLEGHALTARLTHQIDYPYLLLLVSGGHTQILAVHKYGHYERFGSTIDDALGEAFDKTAKLLSLGFPGGPQVERHAKQGNGTRFALPVPMSDRQNCDFSFSGLKTAVRQLAQERMPLSSQDVCDLCASFQNTICAVLQNRLSFAFETMKPGLSQYGLAFGHCGRGRGERSNSADFRHAVQSAWPHTHCPAA